MRLAVCRGKCLGETGAAEKKMGSGGRFWFFFLVFDFFTKKRGAVCVQRGCLSVMEKPSEGNWRWEWRSGGGLKGKRKGVRGFRVQGMKAKNPKRRGCGLRKGAAREEEK